MCVCLGGGIHTLCKVCPANNTVCKEHAMYLELQFYRELRSMKDDRVFAFLRENGG